MSSDDDGGAGSNFRLSQAVGAGTYYVKVRGYSGTTAGNYVLRVAFTGAGGPGDDPATCAYRGSGDQVCAVNRDGQALDDSRWWTG